MTSKLETYDQLRRRHVDERNLMIIKAVRHCDGCRSQAADLLGMHRRQMQRIITDYDLCKHLPPANPGTRRRSM